MKEDGEGVWKGPSMHLSYDPPIVELLVSNVIGPSDNTWCYTPPGLTATSLLLSTDIAFDLTVSTNYICT